MVDAVPVVDESVAWETQQFLNISKLVKKEQYTKALDACNKALSRLPNDSDLMKIKLNCLISLSKFSAALDLAANRDDMKFEKAYCLYRLNEYQKVLDLCESFSKPKPEKVLHLQAQTQYKLDLYGDAISSYKELAKNPVPEMEVLCNMYASYTSGGQGQSATILHSTSENKKYENNFEVFYNRACAHISAQEIDEATENLISAKEICRRTLIDEGLSEKEVRKESAAIDLQEAYIHILSGGESKAAAAMDACKGVLSADGEDKIKDLELRVVAANNLAVLRGDRELPDSLTRLRSTINATSESKLTASQLKELRYNRCILTLHLRKYDECLRLLADFEQLYGDGVGARVAVVRASVFACQRRWLDCESEIKAALTKATGDERDEATLLQAQLLVSKGSFSEAADLISGLSSLKNRPAAVSALLQLGISAGTEKEAFRNLHRAAVNIGAAVDLPESVQRTVLGCSLTELRGAGLLAKAAEVQQLLLGSGLLSQDQRLSVLADLVASSAFLDPAATERFAMSLPPVTNESEIRMEDMEARDVPRPVRKENENKPEVGALTGLKKNSRTVRSPAQVLRRRTRKREMYLSRLQVAGKYDPTRPVKPDPERWLPRNQRSYAKRGRRNKQKFVGGQGSGDGAQKDMLKLDAYAKAQQKKEDEAKAVEEAELKKRSSGRQQKKKR